MIVLDTDYMSLLQWSKGTNRMPFLQRVRSLEAENLATTIVTYEEQTRGWMAVKAKARTVIQEIEAYSRLRRHLATGRSSSLISINTRPMSTRSFVVCGSASAPWTSKLRRLSLPRMRPC